MHLLQKMLVYDPVKRISAKEVKRHRYFRNVKLPAALSIQPSYVYYESEPEGSPRHRRAWFRNCSLWETEERRSKHVIIWASAILVFIDMKILIRYCNWIDVDFPFFCLIRLEPHLAVTAQHSYWNRVFLGCTRLGISFKHHAFSVSAES